MAEPHLPTATILQHRGTRAVQRMVEFAPSSGGLALWVRHQNLTAEMSAHTPSVATDGLTVFYSAAFEKLALPAQAGLVAHAVLHIALRHAQRFSDLERRLGEADLSLFNTCADAIVNSALSHLAWLHLPATSVTLERLLSSALGMVQGDESALLEWDVEQLYRAIDDRRPPQQKGKDGSKPRREDGPKASRVRALGAATAPDLQPRPDAQAQPEADAELTREWAERLLRAHAGDGVHSMLRALLADLPKSRTPWEQVLRTQLARGLSKKLALSWSRPSRSYIANQGRMGEHRRMPWEPGVIPGKSVPRLAVVVDVSGSVDDALLDRFAREIEALTRRLEAGLVLIVGDDRVQHVGHFEPGRSDLRGIEFKGRGGTDFTPLLQEADRHHPDIGVVLTDLDGPARFRPRWPVIWAVPEADRHAVAPFGRKLVLR